MARTRILDTSLRSPAINTLQELSTLNLTFSLETEIKIELRLVNRGNGLQGAEKDFTPQKTSNSSSPYQLKFCNAI